MKCYDDCHTYEMETFMKNPGGHHIQFYMMRPNGEKRDGVTNEEVIKTLLHRLNFLNEKDFKCRENSLAITKLEEALMWLNRRTENRVDRGVEGTHQI